MIRRHLQILWICLLSATMIVISGCDKKDGKEGEKSADKKSEEEKDNGKLTKEALEKLLEKEVEGFEKQAGGEVREVMGSLSAEGHYRGTKANEHGMIASVHKRIYGCGHCPDLTAAAFEAEEHLYDRMMLPATHKENPDAVFEFKEDTIAGKKVVTVYKLSFVVSEDGKTKASMHGLSLYHHNGETMLHLGVSARAFKGFKSAEDLEDLKTRFTREEMKSAATVFFETLAPKLF